MPADINTRQPSASKPFFQGLEDAFTNWAFTDNSSRKKSPAQPVKTCARIVYIMLKEANRANVTLRASALTYTVILSMIPVLAMSTAILKGMGSGDQLRVAAERFIEQVESRPNSSASARQHEKDMEGSPQYRESMAGHLYKAVDTIFDYVDRTNFAALGLMGVASTLVVVIMLFSTVEAALNAIWNSQKGRSIPRKIMDYLALLILFPISINLALAGEAILANENIMGKIYTILPIPWVATALLKFLPFLFVTITLTLMYLFFSRAQVKTGPAILGAFFAACFWFITQQVYLYLQIGVAKYNAIYGSFATVPLFLVWVQIGWTFILLGATLAYAAQNQNTYLAKNFKTTPKRQLQLAYDLLTIITQDHKHRKQPTLSNLLTRLPSFRMKEVENVIETLVNGDLLLISSNKRKECFYLPATTIENITPDEVFNVIIGDETINTPGGKLTETAFTSARQSLKHHNLQT